MRITALEEYGLRCLIQLARRWPGEQMSIAEIASKEGLSIPYTSKLLALLRRANLVVAERGRGGGFFISRPPSEITLFQVLIPLGGPLLQLDHCEKYTGQLDQCVHKDGCRVLSVFDGLASHIEQFLVETTVEQLTSREKFDISDKNFSKEVFISSFTTRNESKTNSSPKHQVSND